MHQYRLTGPYANPKVAAEVYSRQPMGDFLECSITAAFLGASKVSQSQSRSSQHATASIAPSAKEFSPCVLVGVLSCGERV